MKQLIPNAKCLGKGMLKDYQLRLHRFADIEVEPGATTYGVVWRIDNKDETILDNHESVGDNYRAEYKPIYMLDSVLTCRLYNMVPERKLIGNPTRLYIERIANGYKQHNIPLKQLHDAIKRIGKPKDL
jgi:hypothetical protein